MEAQFIRAYRVESDGEQAADGPITFIASSESIARDGFSIAHDGWDLKNFHANPIFLWAHRYNEPSIGRVKASIDKNAKALKAEVTFDEADPFAANIARKYREGFLNAVSVGFDIKEIDGEKVDPSAFFVFPKPGSTVTKSELLELSGIPVPADPKALADRAQRGLTADLSDLLERLGDVSQRGPIRHPRQGPKADLDAEWDGVVEVFAAPTHEATLRAMHAWVSHDGNGAAKSSYALPHHRADADKTLVFAGVKEAMSHLHAIDMPERDRRGVYEHLAAHYREFGQAPPPFRSLPDSHAEVIWPGTALLMARLYLDMTDDADDDERLRRYRALERRYRLLGKEPPEFLTRTDLCLLDDDAIRGLFGSGEAELLGWTELRTAQRAGAVLSSRNKGDLEKAVALVRGVIERAQKEESEEEARAFLSQLITETPADDLLARLAG